MNVWQVPRHYKTLQHFLPARPGRLNPPTPLSSMCHGRIHNGNTDNGQHDYDFHIIKASGRSSRFMYPVGVAILTYDVFFANTFVMFRFKSHSCLDCRVNVMMVPFLFAPPDSVCAHRNTYINYLQFKITRCIN